MTLSRIQGCGDNYKHGPAQSYSLNILGQLRIEKKKIDPHTHCENSKPVRDNIVISQQCTPCSRVIGVTQ